MVIVLLALVNIFGVRLGALVQNIFTTAKVAALVGLVALGFLVGRNPAAIHANFGANSGGARAGNAARGAGGNGRPDCDGWSVRDCGGGADGVAVFRGRVE